MNGKVGFGALLRQYREDLGLTQKELAAALGLSGSYISKLEREDRPPPAHTAMHFVEHFGLEGVAKTAFLDAARRLRLEHRDSRDEKSASRLKDWPPLPRLEEPPVGRDAEIEDIGRLLDRPGAIVSVVGDPAIGKTTVAKALAHQYAQQGRVVIWGDTREEEAQSDIEVELLLWNALIGQELPESRTERLREIHRALRKFRVLLILDNLESAAEFDEVLTYLSKVAPPATVLLTSRRHIPTNLGQNVRLRELRAEDGTALFERTGARYGRQVRTGEEKDIVELICTDFLEGHPGAIEIAAALWRAWPLREILRGLRDKAMITLEDQERTDINRSMRLSIDLSYDLLAKENREAFEVFPRLSVFRASFDHPVVEKICEVTEPLPLLDLLVSRSLVRFDRERYSLHAVVRDYGIEKLAEAREQYELRAALHFLDYTVEFSEDFDALEKEKGNLFSTMEWFEEREEHQELVIHLIELLHPFMDRRGYWEERLIRAQKALKIAEVLDDQAEMARLSFVIGNIYRNRGESEQAQQYFEQGLEFGRIASDPLAIGTALMLSAETAYQQERFDEARTGALQALEVFKTSGGEELLPLPYSLLGNIEKRLGNMESAYQYAQRGLVSARANDDLPMIDFALRDLCDMSLALGDYERLKEHIEEYQARAEEREDPRMLAHLSLLYGTMAFEIDLWSEAREHFLKALSMFQRVGGPHDVAVILQGLAEASESLGDLPGAESYFSQYVATVRSLGHRSFTASGLSRLGEVQEELDKLEEARVSYEEANAIYEELGLSQDERAQQVRGRIEGLGLDR